MNVHRARLAHALVAPGLAQKLLAADRDIRFFHQGDQQGKLLGGQLHAAAVQHRHALRLINGNFAKGLGLAHQRRNLRMQRLLCKGQREHLRTARVERAKMRTHLPVGGNEQNRASVMQEFLKKRAACRPFEARVQQDQRRFVGVKLLDGKVVLVAALCVEFLLLQGVAKLPREHVVRFVNQNHCHAITSLLL